MYCFGHSFCFLRALASSSTKTLAGSLSTRVVTSRCCFSFFVLALVCPAVRPFDPVDVRGM